MTMTKEVPANDVRRQRRMATRRSNVKEITVTNRTSIVHFALPLNSERRATIPVLFIQPQYEATTTAPSHIPAPHCSTSTHCNCHGLWNLQNKKSNIKILKTYYIYSRIMKYQLCIITFQLYMIDNILSIIYCWVLISFHGLIFR